MNAANDVSCVYLDRDDTVCGQPPKAHYISAQTRQHVLGHTFRTPPFPEAGTDYEVWEVREGKPFRLVAKGFERDAAVETAEWTALAATNQNDGSGATEPGQRGFIAVRVDVSRTVVTVTSR